jgi:AraC-like DNA-binding protein
LAAQELTPELRPAFSFAVGGGTARARATKRIFASHQRVRGRAKIVSDEEADAYFATRPRLSGFSKPTMGFVLHVACVFLCKNCSGRKRLFSLAVKIRRAISKERRAAPFHRRLARVGVIKMSLTHESKQTTSRHRAEPAEIWKARKFIEEHCVEGLSLSKVAKAVNINQNHLSEKFKQITGTNFVDYIARARFQNACRLLHDGDLRVSEIAFAVGFQSLSQFNRVFKKFSGKSPSAYRLAHRARRKGR